MKVLVLNLIPNTVGDTLMFIPVIDNIRAAMPSAEIHVTAAPLSQQLLATVPSIDHHIVFRELVTIGSSAPVWKKAAAYAALFAKAVRLCRRERYDSCFVLLPNFAPSHLIPWFGGVRRRYGYSYKGAFFSFLLTKATPFRGPFATGEHDRHTVDSYLDVLRVAGIPTPIDTVSRPVSAEELEGARKVLGRRRDMIVFQTGTKSESRRWPAEHFIELGKRLVKDGRAVVLLGGPKDVEMNRTIARGIGAGCIDATEPLMSIGLSAGALKLARLAVGNDSGLMHLASSVGTRTVVIYGSSNPAHSRPRGTGRSFPVYTGDKEPTKMYGEIGERGVEMMRQVPVDKVRATIMEAT